MIFETFDDAVNALSTRYTQFVERVKEKDPDALISMTRVSSAEFELIVTNSKGGTDNYSFNVSPMQHGGMLKFEISCARVVQ